MYRFPSSSTLQQPAKRIASCSHYIDFREVTLFEKVSLLTMESRFCIVIKFGVTHYTPLLKLPRLVVQRLLMKCKEVFSPLKPVKEFFPFYFCRRITKK